MKNKHKQRFLQAYKWWDYSFLLQAMEDWCENASKQHSKHGHLVCSKDTAKQLKLVSALIKRIREDDVYSLQCKVFNSKNATYDGAVVKALQLEPFTRTKVEIENKQRKQDLQYLFKIMEKKMFSWWD